MTYFQSFFLQTFNDIILMSLVPEQLRYSDQKPAFKKDSRSDKRNYRPVSTLTNISRIYERLLYKQQAFKTWSYTFLR